MTVGCSYTYTLKATGFTPVAIDWSGGATYDNQTSALFGPFQSAGTWTITVTATAPGGDQATFTKSVLAQDSVIPPGQPGGC